MTTPNIEELIDRLRDPQTRGTTGEWFDRAVAADLLQSQAAIKKIVKSTAKMAKIGDFVATPCPKEPKPWRNRSYRELVASLECYHCRVHGHSQCAHPNTSKTKGVKKCDSLCFPMCTVGAKDCHGNLDQYKLVPRAEMQAYEEAAHRWTVATLQARGMWPKYMEIHGLKG